jgi:hypothetical protein
VKLTKLKLRRIIKEERATLLNELNWERLADEIDVDPQIRTVGDLRKIIKTLQSDKRAKLGIEGLKDLGIGALADIIPGAGTVLSLGQTLKSMYSAPDDKKTNTMIDKLNVDDEVAAIVDDTVEDNFLNVALESIEGLSDDANIPDINQKLADWLRSKYDARTVDGFQEGKVMKITKRQLRRIIKEEKSRLLREYGGGDPNSPSGRAIGLYFDVKMMQQVGSTLDGLFHNAMDAAKEDGMEPEEAYKAVTDGIRQLVEDEIADTMRY